MSVIFKGILEDDTSFYADKYPDKVKTGHPKFGLATRCMVFDVNGDVKKIKVPDKFNGDIDKLIMKAAKGLAVEAKVSVKTPIEATTFQVDEVLIEDVE